jgi:hypothetical protein
MKFMRLEDRQYPFDLAAVLATRPNAIFPALASLIDFSELGFAVIEEDVRPACDEDTHQVVEGVVVFRDGVWTQTFDLVPLPADEVAARQEAEQARFVELKRQLVDQIDSTFAAIYALWQRFDSEYVLREAAARAFAAANYEGDPGVWVTSYAVGAGLALRVAADQILAQAEARREALEQLAALRMSKYSIESATDIPAATAAYDVIATRAAEIAATT